MSEWKTTEPVVFSHGYELPAIFTDPSDPETERILDAHDVDTDALPILPLIDYMGTMHADEVRREAIRFTKKLYAQIISMDMEYQRLENQIQENLNTPNAVDEGSSDSDEGSSDSDVENGGESRYIRALRYTQDVLNRDKYYMIDLIQDNPGKFYIYEKKHPYGTSPQSRTIFRWVPNTLQGGETDMPHAVYMREFENGPRSYYYGGKLMNVNRFGGQNYNEVNYGYEKHPGYYDVLVQYISSEIAGVPYHPTRRKKHSYETYYQINQNQTPTHFNVTKKSQHDVR